MTYLLVMLVFWTDPLLGSVEDRYQFRVTGHYNALARCEERKAAQRDTKHRVILFIECRAAE